ncbi:TonB-dependent receptor [Bacteroides oleiciplenus]|uniref:SusC/RagA family TonB-linked outer membrane protein n=1 Tax=Bacteroides oleiciplenus YIT 12058 TaxID=742727 RepID=K9DXB4_9BACE|nr:TonB-dependent receptor [Bacteroides oleiciplenus]EKU89674.1 SusC/RagA family TonB-linked outer membrane protein [Bacteroides oleiciplenus YIT 12058]
MNKQAIVDLVDLKKIIKVMKITFIILIIFLPQVMAGTHAQNKNISIIVQNENLENVLREIEKQSEFLFFYQSDEINKKEKITVNKENSTVYEILDEISAKTNLSYTIRGRHIVFHRKKKGSPDQTEIRISSITQQSKSIGRKLTGIVRDALGDPIIGVNITIKGTGNGTITDINGAYSLNISDPENILVFSYLGYKTKEVRVGDNRQLNITLEENTKELDEVVVIGYGSIKKSSLTGAVSRMNTESLSERSLARAESALQGNLAGVNVRTVTGEPGENMQIRIRGAASVNASSDPLYVVDGVPVSDLTSINPADISSIEVLKDAASAAIYGSRGSNGVVIVTTQKGKTGRPRISFTANYGIQSLEKKIDMFDAKEFMEFYIRFNDAYYLSLAKDRGITASISDPNDVRMKNIGGDISKPNYLVILDDRWFNYMDESVKNSHTYQKNSEGLSFLDWQDEFYRNASIQDYNINLSGGTEATNYFFSAGYLNQEGLAVGTSYERLSFRTNIESKINKYLSAGLLIAPTYTKRKGTGMIHGKDSYSHVILSVCPISPEGVGYDTNIEPNANYPWTYAYQNPIARMKRNIRKQEAIRMLGNAFVRLEPITGLKLEALASLNYYDNSYHTYNFSDVSPTWASGEGVSSSASYDTDRRIGYMYQFLANYDKTFDKHGISAMFGVSAEESNKGFVTSQNFGGPFPNDAITDVFNGAQLNQRTNTVTAQTPKRQVSYFGRMQYNYLERYFFSGSLRYDGGSVFGLNNKWGVFPAFSGAWKLSDEKFFKNLNLKWIDMVKLRASYGVTGNNSITQSAAYAAMGSSMYGDQVGYIATSLGNSDLSWEKTHSTDIALDFAFLKNRVQVSFDWYTKETKDLLYQIPTFGASGFTTTWGNLGNIQNKGFEVELSTVNMDGIFKWNTSFNLSYNTNEVKKLGVSDTPIYSGFDSSNPTNVLMVGKPAHIFYMYDAIGVWMSQKEIDDYSAAHGGKQVTLEGKAIKPGDIRYRDVNDDGVFDKENDRDYLGTPTPKFTYGMTNTFQYKNFDLSILVTAQTGGKIGGFIGRQIDRPYKGPNSNTLGHWRDAWWSEDEPGNGKVPYALSSTTGGTVDSRWLYSSDYIRIRNLTLGYKLPVSPTIIPYARAYISIENLAKWDNYYGGYNTESANAGGTSLGIDYGSYPLARTIMFGINVNF